MPNNYRLTGTRYVSKAGSDANNGLTTNTPKATVQGAINISTAGNTTIIGTGVYKESILTNWTNAAIIVFSADGTVKFLGNNANACSLAPNAGSGINFSLNGIIFENYLTLGNANGSGTAIYSFNNCTFIYIQSITSVSTPTFNNCIFINCVIAVRAGGNTNNFQFLNCIFINTTTSGAVGAHRYTSCYFDSFSVMYIRNTFTPSFFNYNNVEGGIKCVPASTVTSGIIQDILGNYYDLSKTATGGAGTLINPYNRSQTANATFDLINHKIAYPTLNVNSINSSPLFNSATKQDFSLQENSPHIGTGLSGSNIGGTNYAVAQYLNSDLEVISGNTNTTNITFKWANSITTVGVISPVALLQFNKSFSGGTADNINVPDFNVFAAGDATGSDSPDRLTFEMRWTASATQPSIDSEWNNNGLLPAGSYGVFQWFEQPYVDIFGVTSGIYNYNSNSRNRIEAVWLDIRITVRNNYV